MENPKLDVANTELPIGNDPETVPSTSRHYGLREDSFWWYTVIPSVLQVTTFQELSLSQFCRGVRINYLIHRTDLI
jgi:hypothetical protein